MLGRTRFVFSLGFIFPYYWGDALLKTVIVFLEFLSFLFWLLETSTMLSPTCVNFRNCSIYTYFEYFFPWPQILSANTHTKQYSIESIRGHSPAISHPICFLPMEKQPFLASCTISWVSPSYIFCFPYLCIFIFKLLDTEI